MKYDIENCILTLDDFSQCNQEYIKSWVDENISDILSNDNAIYRNYITGELELTITVVYRDYIVGIYYLSNDMLYVKEWVIAHISEVEEPEEQEKEEQEEPEKQEKEEQEEPEKQEKEEQEEPEYTINEESETDYLIVKRKKRKAV